LQHCYYFSAQHKSEQSVRLLRQHRLLFFYDNYEQLSPLTLLLSIHPAPTNVTLKA
jgi:hypothetical protein